jgi:uncharacterized protein involved in exopolysaccharide biosynthesis
MAEQVELIDYLRVVGKRRWLIIGGTVGCVLAALVVSVLLPREYESNLQIKVGRVWNLGIDNPYRVTAIINSEPFLDKLRQKVGVKLSAYEMRRRDVVVAHTLDAGMVNADKNTTLVNVATKGPTPEEAAKLAEAVADLMILEHLPRFKELLSGYLGYEKKLEDQIQVIQNEIQVLDSTIKRLGSNPQVNAPAVILLQAQLEQKQSQLLGFVRELRDVKLNNASKTLTENTRVVLPPVVPQRPVNPKVTLNVVIAGVIGLIAALVMAFFLEYLDRVKRREQVQ